MKVSCRYPNLSRRALKNQHDRISRRICTFRSYSEFKITVQIIEVRSGLNKFHRFFLTSILKTENTMLRAGGWRGFFCLFVYTKLNFSKSARKMKGVGPELG